MISMLSIVHWFLSVSYKGLKITNRRVELWHLARIDKLGIGSVLGVASLVVVPLATDSQATSI
jgi:hypothetical protein